MLANCDLEGCTRSRPPPDACISHRPIIVSFALIKQRALKKLLAVRLRVEASAFGMSRCTKPALPLPSPLVAWNLFEKKIGLVVRPVFRSWVWVGILKWESYRLSLRVYAVSIRSVVHFIECQKASCSKLAWEILFESFLHSFRISAGYHLLTASFLEFWQLQAH